MPETRTPFDWSAVEWLTYTGHPATGTRLQYTDIGPNRWWRVVHHDYDTGNDAELYRYPHERLADRAYRWITDRDERLASLAQLRAKITTDWTVDVIDHDYADDSRDGARITEAHALGVIIKPGRAWSSQGRGYPTMSVRWSPDMVAEGNTVHLYRVPTSTTSRSTPGVPHLVKSFRFHPPRPY